MNLWREELLTHQSWILSGIRTLLGSNPRGPAISVNGHEKRVYDVLNGGAFMIFLAVAVDFKACRQKFLQ